MLETGKKLHIYSQKIIQFDESNSLSIMIENIQHFNYAREKTNYTSKNKSLHHFQPQMSKINKSLRIT